MNNRNDKKELDRQYNDINIKNDSNNDVYNRNNFSVATREYEDLAKSKNALSKQYEKTGVIPRNSNLVSASKHKKKKGIERFNGSNLDSDSQFTDENDNMSMNSCSSACDTNPGSFLKKSEKMMDNRKHERQFVKKVTDDNNYERQFDGLTFDNPGAPVSCNAIPKHHNSVTRMENEHDLALKDGFSNFGESSTMMYGVANAGELDEHRRSMYPWIKGKQGTGANSHTREHLATTNQRKMELFSGVSGRPDWQHKKETEPLFSPLTSISNTYGTPVMTDFYEGRYNPGKERRNELPFQPQKITPGLGLGANGKGSFLSGGGDLYRVLPKTIDELRTLTNQKETYAGRIVDGQKGNKGPVLGAVVHKKPPKFKEYKKNDMQRTGGNYTAPRIIGEINPHTLGGINRGTKETEHFGPAHNNIDKVTTTDMRGKYKKSFKETFLQAEAPGFHLVEGLRGRSTTNDETHIPDPTQRGKDNNYTGPLGNATTDKSYAFDLITNIPNANMRNVHDSYDRTGNGMTTTNQKGQFYDPSDIPANNMRNIHDHYDRVGNAMNVANQHGQYYNVNDVPDVNMRNIHDQADRNGTAMAPINQHAQYYDPSNVPDINMRNVHDQYDRNGVAVNLVNQKSQYYDPSNVPDINMRNVHDQYDRNGVAVNLVNQKSQYYDPSNVPDINMRNVHDQYDRNGTAVNLVNQKSQYYDPNNVPDINMRNVHDQYDRNGVAVNLINQKSQYYDPNNVPDINMRNVHDQYDRNGTAVNLINQKSQYYDPNNVPDVNMRNIHDQYDRNGTAITGDKINQKTVNYDDVPDHTQRNTYNYNDVGPAKRDTSNPYIINYDDVPNHTQRNTYNYNDVGPAKRDTSNPYIVDYNDVPNHTQRNTYNYNDIGPAKRDTTNSYIIDYNDVPNTTHRNTYNHDDIGPAQREMPNSYTINYADATPDVTGRELIGETNYIGPGGTKVTAQRNRNDAYNSKVNVAREVISKGRTPTSSNYNKGPTTKFTEYSLKNVKQSERQHAPALLDQSVDKIPFYNSNIKNKNEKWFMNDRIDCYAKENLKRNPYINNVIHKAQVVYN
jgi:hypothetical protein